MTLKPVLALQEVLYQLIAFKICLVSFGSHIWACLQIPVTYSVLEHVIPVIVFTIVVPPDTRPTSPNATLTEFSIPVSATPSEATVTEESVVKYIASSSNGFNSLIYCVPEAFL